MQCACAILSSVPCPALQYFSTLSHKRYYFRGGGVTEHKMCGLIFSAAFVWNISDFKDSAGYYQKKYMGLHEKCRLFLSGFDGIWIFSTDFLRDTQISDFMKVRPVGAELFHVDGWEDMTKPIATFRNLLNAARRSTSTLCPHSCICVFCVHLRTNSDYFPIQH